MNVCRRNLINVDKPANCNVLLPGDKYTELNNEIPNTVNFFFKVFAHLSKL